MKKIIFIAILFIKIEIYAQSIYFPPVFGSQWDTIAPSSLGWCLPELDSLAHFLSPNTKAFLILKDGKIAVEWYFNSFTRDSIWYWASAGKSITAFVTGMAQQQGLLNLNDSVSTHLGIGFSSATPTQEAAIKVHHLLNMTSGLNDQVVDQNCTTPACLQYLAPPGTRWAYYNAPYRLLHDVIASASSMSFQQYFTNQLSIRTGIIGLWNDKVLYSKPRALARFGLLTLANGIWNGDTILSDTAFLGQMLRPSQNLNQGYGYLWWLNGSSTYMIPSVRLVLPGQIIQNAPTDMVAALGKNDQKIYVIPSKNLVIVRLGEDAGGFSPAISSFDNQLWNKLNNLFCYSTGFATELEQKPNLVLYPNPTTGCFKLNTTNEADISLFDLNGKLVYSGKSYGQELCISLLPGMYIVSIMQNNVSAFSKLVIQ